MSLAEPFNAELAELAEANNIRNTVLDVTDGPRSAKAIKKSMKMGVAPEQLEKRAYERWSLTPSL